MNYFVKLSYDGSNFHGWARQPNNISIQEVIEKALTTIFEQKVNINASGRTDAFVHALEQTFSFNAKKNIDPDNLLISLNKMLPASIHILSIKEVDKNFHARFSAKAKTYIYKIYTGNHNVFNNNYALNYNKPINIRLIKKASKLLLGTHNFKSFSITDVEDTVRTISKFNITKQKDYINIEITGNGFLRGMVRMIVGALLDINENKKTLNDISDLLNNPKKGSSITKARAAGLYLKKVYYKI